MCHEHLARALVELMQIGKTPSGADPVLHHAPKTFNGIEVVATMGGQAMQPTLRMPVCQCRRELFRPMDATAVDDHDDLLPRVTKEGHHLRAILAPSLRINMGDDLIEDFRGALWDRAHDAEPDPTGHAAPTPLAHPRLACAGCFGLDLAVAQRACGPARALGLAPPARPGEGKTPDERFICIEPNNLTPMSTLLQGSECERSPRQLSGLGSEPPCGTAGASGFFFHTARTLSRLSWMPVWRAKPVARS